MAVVFTKKKGGGWDSWALTFMYVLSTSHDVASPLRKVKSCTSEAIWWYILSFELVDEKWTVSLLANINRRDTDVQDIFKEMLRMFWPEDHLRRWYSMWASSYYQVTTSLSCNLEGSNSYQKETSLSEIILRIFTLFIYYLLFFESIWPGESKRSLSSHPVETDEELDPTILGSGPE